jgi:hypothetical protein
MVSYHEEDDQCCVVLVPLEAEFFRQAKYICVGNIHTIEEG